MKLLVDELDDLIASTRSSDLVHITCDELQKLIAVVRAANQGMEMEADLNAGAPDPHWADLYEALAALEEK